MYVYKFDVFTVRVVSAVSPKALLALLLYLLTSLVLYIIHSGACQNEAELLSKRVALETSKYSPYAHTVGHWVTSMYPPLLSKI